MSAGECHWFAVEWDRQRDSDHHAQGRHEFWCPAGYEAVAYGGPKEEYLTESNALDDPNKACQPQVTIGNMYSEKNSVPVCQIYGNGEVPRGNDDVEKADSCTLNDKTTYSYRHKRRLEVMCSAAGYNDKDSTYQPAPDEIWMRCCKPCS